MARIGGTWDSDVFGNADAKPAASRVRLSREQTAERRRELGEFIRSRRERTTPDMVGLPTSARRRTPGLRREEVSLLAGIGATWYTWLEQGRQINVSAQVLLSVVRVLGLDDVERAHVFHLADLPDPEHVVSEPKISPATQLLIDQLSPFPAAIIGPRWQILGSNAAYLGLIGDYRELPECAQNTVWIYFCDPGWRTLAADWAGTAKQFVAKLRGAVAADPGDPGWGPMIDLLMNASPEFREFWARQEVAGLDGAVKCLYHSAVGELDIEVVHLMTGDQRARITVYTPQNEVTRRRLELLAEVTPRKMPGPALTREVDHPAEAESAAGREVAAKA
ncbi:helix-turn-helix transcriptional regulator [Yinghuangia seranimata]|uniref:helix-turn-helix transcriptional regulator n=1 Tax=Yinghuangia seranimata TaxID=408067 RepID=UPI00248B2F3B|nr:helix-turn-helix transcriptional regulator [Yinghuangia seranimata]MDI2129999.1 helix-turn-helix transcriptional regulator [Yinghuangia seranimata]